MKSFKQFTEHASPAGKNCPVGEYYCTKRKKCMPIPRGYHVGRSGWLVHDKRMVMEMATVMGPITGMEVLMAMVAVIAVGTATVAVAAIVDDK